MEECTTKDFNNIIKSPSDENEYRGLVLKNGMKVIIISDPTTKKSAACMSINVGYMSDPSELPGLAHLCEHMLFMGTEKYPEEDAFRMYISQNGGLSNAGTGLDFAYYFFDLNANNFGGALDRFSQFFLKPLFTQSNTEREKKAINSEHEMYLADDSRRIIQVDKFSANENHPYSGFGSGNIETLEIIPKQKNIDVRQELVNFHKKWYSANIMSLSVLGKESLDDLEKMVVKLFADIENKNVEAPKWTEHPFNEEHFQCKWYIVPITNMRKLIVNFPIPDLQKHFRSSPAIYLSQIFEDGREGSLYSILVAEGWVSDIIASESVSATGFAVFSFQMDVTEEGLNNVDEIITVIFQYINMVRKEGPKEWIFNECAAIEKINFRFMEKKSPMDYVHSVSQNLQKYPIEEVLSAPYSLTDWNPDLINSIIDHLTPENIRVQVVAQVYENIATEVEPWYQTKFKKERIPANVIEKWSNAGLDSDFKLPGKNEFIPTKFDLKLDNRNIEKFPVIIKDTPIMRVWFKQDDEFLLPRANLYFSFVSPFANFDPLSCNNASIFVRHVEESLIEYSYAASSSGLEWVLEDDEYGVSLSISGYDDKQLYLLEKIMDKMINCELNEQIFEDLKGYYIQDLENFETEEPVEKAQDYLRTLIAENYWRNDHLLDACAELTIESVRDFVSQMFTNMFVECLIHGNFRKDEALNIASLVNSKLRNPNNPNKGNITPLLPDQFTLNSAISLVAGRHFLYEVEEKTHKSSCTLVYYQNGLDSTKSTMLLKLLRQIIAEPIFTVLRTQEQLGYTVHSRNLFINNEQGLLVIVRSDKHPQYVEERIDKFMESMKERIQNMSDDEFSNHKESLSVKLGEKPKTMATMSDNFWTEISLQMYNFDRANKDVELLKTITKDEILQFHEEVVGTNSRFRKKLSIHSISMAEGGSGLTKETGAAMKSEEKRPIRIEDIDSFKASQFLSLLSEEFVNTNQFLDTATNVP